MFRKLFSGVTLTVFGAAAAFLTAAPAHSQFRSPASASHAGGYRTTATGANRSVIFYSGGYGGAAVYHGTPYSQYLVGYGAYGPYSYSPYYGNPYRHYSGGYGAYSPSYGYFPDPWFSGYGSASNSSSTPANTAEDNYLAASGIPTEEGRPAWPLALRIMSGPEAQALRGQIDILLQIAAAQAAQGSASTGVVEELAQSTNHLRKLLLRHRDERGGLAEHSYEEARRFLDKLGRVPKLRRGS